jgi:hypothetical protein
VTAEPVDLGEHPEIPQPDIAAIQTYGPGAWATPICLATRWHPGDLQPFICARRANHHILDKDRRHLTHRYVHCGVPMEQTTWTDDEEQHP